MVETASNMMPLGTKAPSWTLPDSVSGRDKSLDELASPGANLIMFVCNHCPFVKHLDKAIVQLAEDYQAKDVSIIAISSNDIATHPADSPEKMKEKAMNLGFSFPYLYDETQQVAKDYMAACTPDFYVFDGNLQCTYRGQFDDSRPTNSLPITGADIRAALDATLAGEDTSNLQQKPSTGCNIKWK